MMRLSSILATLIVVCLTACASQNLHKDYGITSAFKAQSPRSILVVPVLNQSVNVKAPSYFLATISKPIAERGYYVFPVNLVKNVMQRNGLSNAYMVHHANTVALAKLFGADSVLYITINNWTAKYSVLSTTVVTEFSYVLKSGSTGAVLWRSHRKMTYTPQSSTASSPIVALITMVIQAAVTKAAPNYIPLARKANKAAIYDKQTGIPVGPYRAKRQAQ